MGRLFLFVGPKVGVVLFRLDVYAVDVEAVLPLKHVRGVGQKDFHICQRGGGVADKTVKKDKLLPKGAEVDDVPPHLGTLVCVARNLALVDNETPYRFVECFFDFFLAAPPIFFDFVLFFL